MRTESSFAFGQGSCLVSIKLFLRTFEEENNVFFAHITLSSYMELSSHPCQAIINNRVLLRSNDGSVWTGFSTDVHTDGRVCTLGHSRWAAGHCEGQTPTRWWQSWTDRRGIVFPFGNWVTMKVVHLCPTLWDPMGYTVHGILQARILEWVAFPFPKGSSQPRDWTQVSCIAGGFFTSWATRGAQEYWSG